MTQVKRRKGWRMCFTQGTGAQIIHCCDVTNPPYLFSGELCTSSLHCKRLFVYTVCCRRAVSASLCSEHVNQTSQWATVVGDVTSPGSDTMCHSCAPVSQVIAHSTTLLLLHLRHLARRPGWFPYFELQRDRLRLRIDCRHNRQYLILKHYIMTKYFPYN